VIGEKKWWRAIVDEKEGRRNARINREGKWKKEGK